MQGTKFDMRRVTEAKRLLDRVDTYDAITRFELANADLLYNAELAEASSDNEPYLLEDRVDAKRLQQARQLWQQYREAVRATRFAAPELCAAPTEAGRSQLEDIIDRVKTIEDE